MIIDDPILSMMETVIIPVIQWIHRQTEMHSVLQFPMLPAEHQKPAFTIIFANLHQMENIMDNHPVIGWAKAKQGSHMHQATLWALPQALAKPLYIYLGVIWPDTLQVLNQVSRAVTCEH
jgi:hypothetical protein